MRGGVAFLPIYGQSLSPAKKTCVRIVQLLLLEMEAGNALHSHFSLAKFHPIPPGILQRCASIKVGCRCLRPGLFERA